MQFLFSEAEGGWEGSRKPVFESKMEWTELQRTKLDVHDKNHEQKPRPSCLLAAHSTHSNQYKKSNTLQNKKATQPKHLKSSGVGLFWHLVCLFWHLVCLFVSFDNTRKALELGAQVEC